MSPFKKRLATFTWILLIGIALFSLHKGISMVKVGEKHISNHLVNWEPYSDELVSSYRAENKFVFVDFTADWCLTCQVNERLTFHSDEVIAKIKELDIKMIKADWTDRRDDITNALTKLGRSGVPANVLYKPNDKDPIILSEILTASKFLDAFKEGEKK